MKLSKPEFCSKMQMGTNELSVYLSRRKVILNDSDEIDDADPVNFMFIQKRQAKLDKKPAKDKVKKKVEKAVPAVTKKPQNEEISRENTKRDEYFDAEREKQQLELKKRRNDIDMQEHEIAKKRGELIPTEIVRKLIIQQSEGTKIAYTEASENLIGIMAQKKEMSAEEVADLKKTFIDIVNTAIDNSIKISKRNMEEIVKEFSKKRGVGQHG